MAGSRPNPNPNPNPVCPPLRAPSANSHKKRDLAQVVPRSKVDEDLLNADHNLLVEGKRIMESSGRMRKDLSLNDAPRLPFIQKLLRYGASKRKTSVLFMPKAMSRRKKNESRYSKSDDSISWTIEWMFSSAGVFLTEHGVGESENLSTVIEKHLAPNPWKNPLRPYSNLQLDELKFFIQKDPKVLKFRELDIKAPLKQQLSDIIVVEFPTIYVFLPSESYDFEVERVEVAVDSDKEPRKMNSDDIMCFAGEINYDEAMDLAKRSGNSSHLGGDLAQDDEPEEGKIPS